MWKQLKKSDRRRTTARLSLELLEDRRLLSASLLGSGPLATLVAPVSNTVQTATTRIQAVAPLSTAPTVQASASTTVNAVTPTAPAPVPTSPVTAPPSLPTIATAPLTSLTSTVQAATAPISTVTDSVSSAASTVTASLAPATAAVANTLTNVVQAAPLSTVTDAVSSTVSNVASAVAPTADTLATTVNAVVQSAPIADVVQAVAPITSALDSVTGTLSSTDVSATQTLSVPGLAQVSAGVSVGLADSGTTASTTPTANVDASTGVSILGISVTQTTTLGGTDSQSGQTPPVDVQTGVSVQVSDGSSSDGGSLAGVGIALNVTTSGTPVGGTGQVTAGVGNSPGGSLGFGTSGSDAGPGTAPAGTQTNSPSDVSVTTGTTSVAGAVASQPTPAAQPGRDSFFALLGNGLVRSTSVVVPSGQSGSAQTALLAGATGDNAAGQTDGTTSTAVFDAFVLGNLGAGFLPGLALVENSEASAFSVIPAFTTRQASTATSGAGTLEAEAQADLARGVITGAAPAAEEASPVISGSGGLVEEDAEAEFEPAALNVLADGAASDANGIGRAAQQLMAELNGLRQEVGALLAGLGLHHWLVALGLTLAAVAVHRRQSRKRANGRGRDEDTSLLWTAPFAACLSEERA